MHDLIIDDLNKNYLGGGDVFEIMNAWPKNPLNTVTINHVTAIPDPAGHLSTIGNMATNQPMFGLVFTNNVVMTAQFPIWSTGGGSGNCAYHDVPVTTISACFTSYTFTNNALVAPPSVYPPSAWPSGNFFPATVSNVSFVNFNSGNGGDYSLLAGSPFHNKGTDGRDLGADISAVTSALAGVE